MQARQPEVPPGLSVAAAAAHLASSAQLAPIVSVSPELQLEIERLRAERDALAAELQIERAERVRAEERLRLFEREKLEQMRDGAASREKLASELEEARLRAMRAEARQAALDADLRLSEIADRRRGWPGAEPDRDPGAGAIAERDADAPSMEDGEPAPPPAESHPRRLGSEASMRGGTSKYSLLSRGGAAAREPAPAARAARADADAASERMAREAIRSERPATSPDPSASPGRLRMSEVPEPRWPSQGASPTPPREEWGPGARTPPPRTSAPPGARAGAGAQGGAAAGRPSIDRAQLEMRLAAGQIIETTDRFRQFQPVAQSHIKICDLLASARTLDAIDKLAAGEVARSEIISILTLFFERSFLVFKQE
jgi:hypothetical protein